MKIDNVKRLVVENFEEDHQNTVSKIAEIYNFFAEQITNAINGNIDIDNLNRQLIEMTVKVDSNGTPIGNNKFSANTGMRGSKVIRALNKTNNNKYVVSCPFISYSPTSVTGVYIIKNIVGLEANQEYQLLIELIP